MRHEKIIVRPDKTKYIIMVDAYMDSYHSEKMVYNTSVDMIPPGKRKSVALYSGDDWDYRKLSMEDRKVWVLNKQLQHLTYAELLEAKRELWLKLEPK